MFRSVLVQALLAGVSLCQGFNIDASRNSITLDPRAKRKGKKRSRGTMNTGGLSMRAFKGIKFANETYIGRTLRDHYATTRPSTRRGRHA